MRIQHDTNHSFRCAGCWLMTGLYLLALVAVVVWTNFR